MHTFQAVIFLLTAGKQGTKRHQSSLSGPGSSFVFLTLKGSWLEMGLYLTRVGEGSGDTVMSAEPGKFVL